MTLGAPVVVAQWLNCVQNMVGCKNVWMLPLAEKDIHTRMSCMKAYQTKKTFVTSDGRTSSIPNLNLFLNSSFDPFSVHWNGRWCCFPLFLLSVNKHSTERWLDDALVWFSVVLHTLGLSLGGLLYGVLQFDWLCSCDIGFTCIARK